MCFMAIGEENSNISYDDLHDAFENIRILKSLVWKMFPLKRKFKNLKKNLKKCKKNVQILKMLKLFLKRRMRF